MDMVLVVVVDLFGIEKVCEMVEGCEYVWQEDLDNDFFVVGVGFV